MFKPTVKVSSNSSTDPSHSIFTGSFETGALTFSVRGMSYADDEYFEDENKSYQYLVETIETMYPNVAKEDIRFVYLGNESYTTSTNYDYQQGEL